MDPVQKDQKLSNQPTAVVGQITAVPRPEGGSISISEEPSVGAEIQAPEVEIQNGQEYAEAPVVTPELKEHGVVGIPTDDHHPAISLEKDQAASSNGPVYTIANPSEQQLNQDSDLSPEKSESWRKTLWKFVQKKLGFNKLQQKPI